jgi:hypothetical protein
MLTFKFLDNRREDRRKQFLITHIYGLCVRKYKGIESFSQSLIKTCPVQRTHVRLVQKWQACVCVWVRYSGNFEMSFPFVPSLWIEIYVIGGCQSRCFDYIASALNGWLWLPRQTILNFGICNNQCFKSIRVNFLLNTFTTRRQKDL